MLSLLFVITLVIGSISSVPTDDFSQSRNVAFQFRDMIGKVTGRSALDYLNYGCYCGLGGSGKAVDALDTCCELHDRCYANTSKYLQFWNLCSPHLVPYSWSMENNTVTCNSNKETCAYKTCICDKIVAECFVQSTYNIEYKGFNKALC